MALNDGRDEYRNETQGWVGAVQINRKGDEVSLAVPAGSSVFLNEEERELTARAHADPADNPFEPRAITFYDELTRDPVETKTVAPLTRVEEQRATGAAEEPVEEPVEGERAEGEEVGTPEAEQASGDAPKGEHGPDEEVGTPDAPAKAKPKRSNRRKRATADAG